MGTLTDEERNWLWLHILSFKRYLQTDAGHRDQEDRQSLLHFFQHELPARLTKLRESDVAEIVYKLRSMRFCGNKEYVVQELIKDNGLEGVAEGLEVLLDKAKPPAQRYEQGLSKIRGLGVASVTEILCYADPANCAIWNWTTREAMNLLKLERFVPLNKWELSPKEYGRFNALAKAIVVELEAAEIPGNLATVDLFLCETGRRPILEKQVSVGEPIVEPDFDRDVVKEIVKNIGVLLGFDVQTEVNIAHDAVVDVVWRVGTDNPGEVTYAFEVHKSGSIDNLLVILQKAMCRAMVQKVVTISDQQQLEKIARKCEELPKGFRKTLAYWPVEDVFEVFRGLIMPMSRWRSQD